MTEFIDLIHYKKYSPSNQTIYTSKSSLSKHQNNCLLINEALKKIARKIDKNYIKTSKKYIFRIDTQDLIVQNGFYNRRLKLFGTIFIKNYVFHLRIQLLDQKGSKITATSIHHRTLLSNFVLQMNGVLQNFKIEYNPVSGEFSFVFSSTSEKNDTALLSEIMQFGLSAYFSQYKAHFYLLNLIQYVDIFQNEYIQNIQKEITEIKQWILERKMQNKCYTQNQNFFQMYMKTQNQLQESQNQGFLTIETKNHNKKIDKIVFSKNNREINRYPYVQNKNKQDLKKFKKYYSLQNIFMMHLSSNGKHQNYINISVKETKSFQQFIYQNSMLNTKQIHQEKREIRNLNFSQNTNYSKFQRQILQYSAQKNQKQQKINICDKNTGKNYLVKCTYLNKQNARTQYIIFQKLCKFDSFKFINQYVEISNFNIWNEGYVLVNAYPTRLTLKQFLFRNDQHISFNSRIKISINIVQIILALQAKSKINNYFPFISTFNLEISQNLNLNFKSLSAFTKYPLFQLCNTISVIFFMKPVNILKKQFHVKKSVVQGDQKQNKNWGPSIYINLLKYYLLELNQESNTIISVKQLRNNKKIPQQYCQQMQDWSKRGLRQACKQLLVILSHFQTILEKGFEEQYSFYSENQQQK